MRKSFISLLQGDYKIYLISLSIEELLNNTEVMYYNSQSNEFGYQRPLVPNHYRKIAKYLQTDQPFMPPAIITAVDPEQISEKEEVLLIKGMIRLVDGQHRVAAIKYLKKTDNESFKKISSYEFPTIMMIVDSNKPDYIREISTFIDINSKGKRVKTDLAMDLKESIRKKSGQISDLYESTAIKIAQEVSEEKTSLWFNAIRRGDDVGNKKPISINAFSTSIKPIIQSYIQFYPLNNDTIIDVSDEIKLYVIKAWEIVAKRWALCFEEPNYNIQKGIGVFPIHIILAESLIEAKGNIDNAIKRFISIINKSNVVEMEWRLGGRFSPFNSKAGFNEIVKHIKNESSQIEM